jgi:cytochrome c
LPDAHYQSFDGLHRGLAKLAFPAGSAGLGGGEKPREATAMKASWVITAAALMAALMAAPAAQAQDAAAGEQAFRKCRPCHDVGPAAKNKVGPELNGLDGRHSGSVAGYSYSPANKKSGIVWDEQSFKAYIRDPRAKIPGTKMIFPGIKNEKEIDTLRAYLSQFGPDGGKK